MGAAVQAKCARPRLARIVEQLRGPGGWQDATVQLPSGGTVRTEMHTKNAKDILSSLYPRRTFYPQCRDGVVAARYTPVVKLDVREGNATLLFDMAALPELEIDKSDVLRPWERDAATPSQAMEWRSSPCHRLMDDGAAPCR